MIVLQTPRLVLRPFCEGDLDALSVLMANPDFMRFSLGVFSREQTAAFLERVRDRDSQGLPSQFAVVSREENRLLGYCGFFLQIVDGIEELEIGYRLHRSYWGRGIATEAARAVRDHGFDDLQLPHVISSFIPKTLRRAASPKKTECARKRKPFFADFRPSFSE